MSLPQPGSRTFGISVTPYADNHREIVAQVMTAERVGLDLVGIQDHPYQRRFLDTYTLIADLLARTERVTFFPDVTSLPMRPPAMIAKAAASLDVMSDGRFELGLGAGAFWDAVEGMGGQVRAGADRLGALEEALTLNSRRTRCRPGAPRGQKQRALLPRPATTRPVRRLPIASRSGSARCPLERSA